jgi:hypothetical protein
MSRRSAHITTARESRAERHGYRAFQNDPPPYTDLNDGKAVNSACGFSGEK